MHAKRIFLLVILFCVTPRLVISIADGPPALDAALAEQYFQEAEAICRAESGKIWGAPLCGPMLFVDAATREVVANRSDMEGKLTRRGDLFVGRLPESENCANTATRWAGVKWTMILWPLPSDKAARARLMVHELFHRVQDDFGLPARNPSNDHLDSMEGRIWLQLEWRALREALTRQGNEEREALKDALIFRAYRRALTPAAAANERGLEMNEGLAEYTGVKLGFATEAEAVAHVARQLERFEKRPTFVRSFAYASGPAYGLLLDQTGADWRKGLKAEDDFGAMAEKLFSIKLPANLREEAARRAAKYDGATLRAAETERENQRVKRVAENRARFIEKAILIAPLTDHVSYSFDPNNVESLDQAGTVYPTLRVSDEWGILTVEKGALMIREAQRVSRVHVTAPANTTGQKLQGDGWTLELKEGWKLEPAARKGDYVIKKSGAQ